MSSKAHSAGNPRTNPTELSLALSTLDAMAALDRFSPVARAWFESAFEAPTDAQAQGWDAISRGDHTLILAPTGSGKTLAAFLWALDRLVVGEGAAPPPTRSAGCGCCTSRPSRPSPTTSSATCGRRWPAWRWRPSGGGWPVPDVRVGIRTGDTSQSDRRDIVRHPPDILVTTPESLYLMLTSGAREVLQVGGVRDRRRDPLGGGHQAGRPPGPVAGAPGAAHGRRRSAGAGRRSASACRPPSGRSTRWPASWADGPATRDRRVGAPAGGGGRRRGAQAARAGGDRPGRRHGRAGQGHPRRAGRAGRGRPRGPPLDLAGHAPRPARPHPLPHVDPHLRELPAPGRAAGGPAERPGRRGAGAGPPRVDRPGAAARDRGRS